jgi:hypothetical protein
MKKNVVGKCKGKEQERRKMRRGKEVQKVGK